MSHTYYVRARDVPEGVVITVDCESLHSQLERVSTELFHLKDKAVADALIRLGWTPPPEATHEGT